MANGDVGYDEGFRVDVMRALWILDELNFQTGDFAIVTGDSRAARVIAAIAAGSGALYTVLAGSSWLGASQIGVKCVSAIKLPQILGSMQDPGGANRLIAIEHTGSADLIGALLSRSPMSTRLMLAAAPEKEFDIDFYLGMHKRGLMCQAVQIADLFSTIDLSDKSSEYALYASRLLRQPWMRHICRHLTRD